MDHRPDRATDTFSDANGNQAKPIATQTECSRSTPLVIVGCSDIHSLGLRQVLIQNRFRNVVQAPTLREAKLTAPGRPQLILITEPALEAGLQATVSAVRAANEVARIVVFVDTGNEALIETAMGLSAHAFLDHRITARALVNALDVVLGSGSVLSINFVPRVVARSTNRPIRSEEDSNVASVTSQLWPLSNREEDVLKCLTDGVSNKLIARKFDIAESTVKIHVKSILRKINVCNRTQAAVWALAHAPWQTSSAPVQEIAGSPVQLEDAMNARAAEC